MKAVLRAFVALLIFTTTIHAQALKADLNLALGIDSSGSVRAVLTLNRDGVPVLDFVEKGGARHAGLTVGSEGRPLLFLTDAEGRPIWKSP